MAPRGWARLFPLLSPMLLGACATAHYACGLPEGVTCKPVSTVYAASLKGMPHRDVTGPAARGGNVGARSTPLGEGAVGTPAAVVATVKPGDPLLSPPKQLRVWINRWEDQAGDLHDETYLYLRLDNGRWRLPP